MPKRAKNTIYGKLYQICKPFVKDYLGCAEHAFYDQEGQSARSDQKALAIRSYLKDQQTTAKKEAENRSQSQPTILKMILQSPLLSEGSIFSQESSSTPSAHFPLLTNLGIVHAKDYSEQLGCTPEHLQKIGILSQEDLQILCPDFTLTVDFVQEEVDTNQIDFIEQQKVAHQRQERLLKPISIALGALQKMTAEVNSCGVVLYEFGCPWADLEQALNAFQAEIEKIKSECEGLPRKFVQAFQAEKYNQLVVKLNTLIKKVNEEFPSLYRNHQIKKLHTYINQWGILSAWNNRRDPELPQNLASLESSQQTLRSLFHIGE